MGKKKSGNWTTARQRALWGPGWENYYAAFWSKEEVINRIRSLANRGARIHLAGAASRGEWHLIRAASHFFGSWRAAVKAAGFNYDEVRADRIWSREKVVQMIRRLRREGQPLNSRAVQIQQPALFAAACHDHIFGGWAQAVKASGLDYDKVRRYEQWDEARLRKEVAAAKRSGIPLNARSISRRRPHLYWAGCRRYGSWGKTLSALGYDAQSVALRKKRSREEIIEGIRDLHRKGVRLAYSNVRARYPALHAAACRAFGGWVEARRAALNGQARAWRQGSLSLSRRRAARG